MIFRKKIGYKIVLKIDIFNIHPQNVAKLNVILVSNTHNNFA